MLKLTKLLPIAFAALIVAESESPAQAQWDRSYLQVYPQCDMTGNFNSSVQQQYLQAFGDPARAQQAMLRDLYNQEMRCLQSQQQQQNYYQNDYQTPDYNQQVQEQLRQTCESKPGRVWTGTSCYEPYLN